jgi:hypothetical protein
MRPSGANRGKRRIPDGKVGERSGLNVWSSKVGSPHLSRLWTNHLVPVSKFDYVLTHTRFMGSHKLSSIVCRLVGHTLPLLTDVIWDSVQATHRLPTEVLVWTMTLGRGRTRPNSLTASWTVAAYGVFVTLDCRVAMWFTLEGLNWLESPWHS